MHKCWPIFVGLCGFVIHVFGLVSFLHIIPRIEKIYFSNEALNEKSPQFKEFVQPTKLLCKFKAYIFDVINPESVVRQQEKPIIRELGPYVYDKKIIRTVKKVNPDSIEYKEKTYYFFNQAESLNNTDNEIVTTVNVLLASLCLQMEAGTILPPNVVEEITNTLNTFFIKTTIRNLLFDGISISCQNNTSILCTFLSISYSSGKNMKRDGDFLKIFVLPQVNGTEDGPFVINANSQHDMKGEIIKYQKSDQWKAWGKDNNCADINGNALIIFQSLSLPPQKIRVFVRDVCRSIELVFKEYSTYDSIPIYVYKSTVEAVDAIKKNSCYCKNTKGPSVICNSKGIMEVQRCSRFFFDYSYPHFYLGDPAVINFVQGLEPYEKLHQSFVVIEPKSGAPLESAVRLQINIKISKQKLGNNTKITKFYGGYYPILWYEDTKELSKPVINWFKEKHHNMKILNRGKYILVFSGILIMIISIVLVALEELYFSRKVRISQRDSYLYDINKGIDLDLANLNLYPQIMNRDISDSFKQKSHLRLNVKQLKH